MVIIFIVICKRLNKEKIKECSVKIFVSFFSVNDIILEYVLKVLFLLINKIKFG